MFGASQPVDEAGSPNFNEVSWGSSHGFFVQEENADTDADLTTSEGIFIFDGSSPSVDVNVGDVVQVTLSLKAVPG